MKWARPLELLILLAYLAVAFVAIMLLSGNPYEWMIGESADAPRNLCELPTDPDPAREVGVFVAALLSIAGLGAGLFFRRQRRGYLFFVAAALVAGFAVYRLYVREHLCL